MTNPTPILPKEGERNILITSALPYVNNVPHLGNIIGCVLSADVFARFCRARGLNTLFVCGTDEYGTATETKARAEGLSCEEICAKYRAIHAAVYEWFQISFDHFGKTSTEQQTEIAQHIFKKCNEHGFISSKETEQWYCEAETCASFLADRFVEGTCPNCSYDDARGDQCDNCGHPVDAKELTNPRCKFTKGCGNTPVLKTSRHLYLELGKIQPEVSAYIEEQFEKGIWSKTAIDITRSWFDMGLRGRAITRDLRWGTPVPLEGFEDKVFYVWFDAPIGYISITANYTDEWRQWWYNPDNVDLYQFMAKDNVLFHSIIFPSSLLGTREGWTKVKHLSATEYLNYEDKQFSKSRGIGVFGNNAQESGLPSDVYRFYLLYKRPEGADTQFDWEDLITKHNTELLNKIGNFVHRTVKFTIDNFSATIQKIDETDDEKETTAAINKEIERYVTVIEKHLCYREPLEAVIEISAIGNTYIQRNKPWDLLKASKNEALPAEERDASRARAGTVLAFAANIVSVIANLLSPFIPASAEKIFHLLNVPSTAVISDTFSLALEEGHTIYKPATKEEEEHMILFTRIDPAKAAEWREKYGGEQEKETSDKATEELIELPSDPAALEVLIAQQGDIVRDLKKAGADKAEITAQVTELKRRKKALAALVGPSEDDKKKEKKKKASSEKAKQNKKKNKKKEYTGAIGEEIKSLGREIAEQSKKVRTARENNDDAMLKDEMKIMDDMKQRLQALKIKGDAEIAASEAAGEQ